jgi:putative phosphoribosyl transferase
MVVDVEGVASGPRRTRAQGEPDGEPGDVAAADQAAPFFDRREAGARLGAALAGLGAEDVVVIALPRGGVVVGAEVAAALGAPLDIWIVRKIGAPGHEELGLGAVAEGGFTHLSEDIVRALGIGKGELGRLVRRKHAELDRRTKLLRGERPRPLLAGKTVVLVDDGIATGGTIRAVAGALRRERPRRLVLAAPVAAADTLAALAHEFDRVVCLEVPRALHAVGLWYEDFRQIDDDEVIDCLRAARASTAGASKEDEPT